MRRLRLLILSLVAGLFCLGRDKTDSVTVRNGNVITCEIRSLSRGVLTAKTDSLSTISIRWEDVTRVRSEHVYEIVLSDGSTEFGPLTPAASGGISLPGRADVPLIGIVALTQIRSRTFNRFDGAVDLGYSFLKSSTTTQFNFAGEIRYTARRRVVHAQLNNILLIREDTATTRRSQIDLGLRETLSRSYFALGIGQYSLNDELKLLHRYLGGGALGRSFVRTNRAVFSAYGGGAYSSERYSGGDRLDNGEGLVGVNAQVFRLFSPKVDLNGSFRLWPSFTTAGRYRIDAEFKARVEVYKNLFVSFSYFDNYDRKSPTTAAPRNDFGVVTAIGYGFNR
jgi:Protein of unknown function, DUF481